MTRTSVALLINGIKMKFPNATITFSAALPTREGTTKGIIAYNSSCSDVCFTKMAKHVDFSQHFLGKKNLYSTTENDHVHLGEEGTTLLTSLLRQCLGLESPAEPLNLPDNSNITNTKQNIEKQDQSGSRIETRVTRETHKPPPNLPPPSFVHTDSNSDK